MKAEIREMNKEKTLWATNPAIKPKAKTEILLEIEGCKDTIFSRCYESLEDMICEIIECKEEIQEAIKEGDRLTMFIQDKNNEMRTYIAEDIDNVGRVEGIFFQIVVKLEE